MDLHKRKKSEILLNVKIDEEVSKNKKQQLLIFQQNRLAQMGEMISMIAHQWRQPLNSLAILTQTISFKYNRGKLSDEIDAALDKTVTDFVKGFAA